MSGNTGDIKPTRDVGEVLSSIESLCATITKKQELTDQINKSEIKKTLLSVEQLCATVVNVTCEQPDTEPIEPPLVMSYPRSGKKELPVGATIININEGKVELPDGTREDIYMAHPVETCRSFTISTSRQIEIRASMDGTLVYTGSLFTGSQQTHNLAEFDTIEIDADAVTAFHITMSEDAEGAPSVQPETDSEMHIGYNAAGDIVSLKKVADGVTYQRSVTDPDVADTTVDRWVVYGTWAVV